MKQLILIALIATGLPGISFARAPANKPQEVKLQVTERGFEPNRIDVKPGTDVVLKVTRTTNNTCATAIRIPSKKIKMELPLNKTVSIDLGKLEKGDLKFACGMKMLSGMIVIN